MSSGRRIEIVEMCSSQAKYSLVGEPAGCKHLQQHQLELWPQATNQQEEQRGIG